MKKSSLILALIVALAMVFGFIGCDVGETDITKESSREVKEPEVFLFDIPITKNQWSNNASSSKGLENQVTFKTINAEAGTSLAVPKKGDKLTFNITVVPDTDVDAGELYVFVLDRTPSYGYWNEIGVWLDNEDLDGGTLSADKKNFELNALEEKKEFSFSGTFKVKAGSKGDIKTDDLGDIALVFRSDNLPWSTSVTLKVKSFIVE